MAKAKITLYECHNAKVIGSQIKCAAGHELKMASQRRDGVRLDLMMQGRRLGMKVCQACIDFVRNGPPVPKEDRGWSPD